MIFYVAAAIFAVICFVATLNLACLLIALLFVVVGWTVSIRLTNLPPKKKEVWKHPTDADEFLKEIIAQRSSARKSL